MSELHQSPENYTDGRDSSNSNSDSSNSDSSDSDSSDSDSSDSDSSDSDSSDLDSSDSDSIDSDSSDSDSSDSDSSSGVGGDDLTAGVLKQPVNPGSNPQQPGGVPVPTIPPVTVPQIAPVTVPVLPSVTGPQLPQVTVPPPPPRPPLTQLPPPQTQPQVQPSTTASVVGPPQPPDPPILPPNPNTGGSPTQVPPPPSGGGDIPVPVPPPANPDVLNPIPTFMEFYLPNDYFADFSDIQVEIQSKLKTVKDNLLPPVQGALALIVTIKDGENVKTDTFALKLIATEIAVNLKSSVVIVDKRVDPDFNAATEYPDHQKFDGNEYAAIERDLDMVKEIAAEVEEISRVLLVRKSNPDLFEIEHTSLVLLETAVNQIETLLARVVGMVSTT